MYTMNIASVMATSMLLGPAFRIQSTVKILILEWDYARRWVLIYTRTPPLDATTRA